APARAQPLPRGAVAHGPLGAAAPARPARVASVGSPAMPGRTLSEADSKHLLAAHGVPFAPERRASSADEAVAAAEELGLPVVLKLNGDAIAHKTERGLVRLGLA